MKKLLDIVSAFREYIVFTLCILIAIFLLTVNDGPQIRAIRSITIVSIGFLQGALAFIPNYFDLREEHRILRERNLNLSSEVSLLRESRLENIRLRHLLGFKERARQHYISANVVGKNTQLLRNTITIDVGESDGVKVNMPIVTDGGLVGKIIATSSGYAVGQLVLNKDFRASAKVQRGRVDGIIVWEGGDMLLLKNVARTLDVREGDVIQTSEFSNLFPPGIRVGVVSEISQKQGALFQTIEVTPGVDFNRLEEVFVVRHQPDTSRMAVENRIGR
ncbi:MAG: rod shape-determining protein MreC [Ignavibacteriae bacterium]|nr:rod shape-determining protein MreC [Ignavibacteriota bacterium]